MRYCLLPALLLGLIASPAAFAGHGHKVGKVSCPACNYVCQLTKEHVTETKHCYNVACEPICIPPITFPWEKGLGKGKGNCPSTPNRCGKVRVVRVLVKEEYECTRCKCKWTAVPINGKKLEGSYGEPAVIDPGGEGTSDVPHPPAVEARLRRQAPGRQLTAPERAPSPAAALSSPAQPKYLEILTGFFKR